MPNPPAAHTIEIWRSRCTPRDLVYWRYVTCNGRRYPPECGAAQRLARLLWAARERYGTPRRGWRITEGGRRVRVYTWDNAPCFYLEPSDWKWRAT